MSTIDDGTLIELLALGRNGGASGGNPPDLCARRPTLAL